MTWQLSSFGLLAAVLVGGAIWFERSRPSAKVVAMVAALAALAVAGRVALAPIPNVVATTDIVLLTGYAVGGAPGFAVGSLAALVSNFWLGQGPWTPWQMAGWGLVGIGGALLARASGRRLGRFGLAFWCGVAGLAYGALLDLSTMVTYGGEQSLDRYLALSVRGIPFNVAHALGNIVFALIAGPALVRMLLRFRSRIEVTWKRAPATPGAAGSAGLVGGAGLLLACVSIGALLVAGAPARAEGPADASSWLAAAQNPDGGFGTAPDADSSLGLTAWAALGLEAAGRNPLDVETAGRSAIDYLRANGEEIRATNDLVRTVLVLAAAGIDPHDFAGRDLAAELAGRQRDDGSFQRWPNLTAFGMLALDGAGGFRSAIRRGARWLRETQNEDGGWGAVVNAASDADTAGSAIQALAASGGDKVMKRAVRYLLRTQRADGGWALTPTGPTNSQSTAWAVQGLLAAGKDPRATKTHGHSPLDYLAARQLSDGHFRYSTASDQTPVWVTAQALMAVERAPFPLGVVPRAPAATNETDTVGGGGSRTGAGSSPSHIGSATFPASRSSDRTGRGNAENGGAPAAPGPGTDHADSGAPASPVSSPGSTDYAPLTVPGQASTSGGGNSLAIAVLIVAGVVLAGGFFWYRRLLP